MTEDEIEELWRKIDQLEQRDDVDQGVFLTQARAREIVEGLCARIEDLENKLDKLIETISTPAR